MKTFLVAVIISVATADFTTTTTRINNRNNSESTYIKNLTASTIKVSILTTDNPQLVNTTESTNVLLSRKNGTITRQGHLTEVLNNITSVQYRNQYSNEDKNISQDDDHMQIEFVTKPTETQRKVLRNIFQKILSYKQLYLEKPYKNEKEKIINAYLLLVSQKYKRKWVPNNIGVKVLSVKNVTSKVRTQNKRTKRSIKEEAGFTHDAETCKQYNNNLLLLWSNLSKYIGTSEISPPNKSVLHNIGIMVKAYLDHVSPIEITEPTTENLTIRKERNISNILAPIVKEIKIKMDGKEINDVNTLTAFILGQVKRFRIDNVNAECNEIIQSQIVTLINNAFKKYLLYANCYNNHIALYNRNPNLSNMPLNNKQLYGKLQTSNVPKLYESRFDNLLKLVKRSAVDTTANAIETSIDNTDLTTIKGTFNNTNTNNVTTNATNGANDNLQNSSQSRKALQLNGKYCADLALDQFILTVKLILRLYLLNDDCAQKANKFIIISKLIEATPILESFNANNIDYLSQYHVLLQLLDKMETGDMSNIFSTTKAEVLQNKNTLEEFLRDINNIALSINFKQTENNNVPDSNNDLNRQNLLNSLYNQQLSHNSNGIINPNNSDHISMNTGITVISPTDGNNEVNQNFKELQDVYTNVPTTQYFEANRSVIYDLTNSKTYEKPINIGATINSGSINYSKNYLTASDTKGQLIPSNLFTSTAKEYSAINPLQYNLIMNYSETFPTNVKGNLDSTGFVFPHSNVLNSTSPNMNPFKNTLLYQNLASNSGPLSNYFSKFTNINNNQGHQINNSPALPNNSVLLNILTKNNKGMLNSNFNTKSELTINESNVKNYLHNPDLEQHLNGPSNFAVDYYNQINNALINHMNSYPKSNDNLNSLHDNNLVSDKKYFNPFNFNALHLMPQNFLRSNLYSNDIKNSLQPNNFNGKLVLRNSYPLRTLNAPQIQKSPVIYRTDFKPNSSIDPVHSKTLQEINSSYIKSQFIQIPKISGVPLKTHNQGLSKNLFINPFSYSKGQILNKENEFEKYFNSANAPVLRSNFLRANDQQLENKTSPITSVDNLPTITSDPDANGDVELTYVFHHPQIVVYQPQVLVKRRISYIDYINNFNKIFNNQKKNQQQLHLYKITRYLPHNNVQVLYQSDSLFPILKVENSTSTN